MKMHSTASDPHCTLSLEEALLELNRVAPKAPFLALGQTIFWDEPMKAGVQLCSLSVGKGRKFVAGVHDTDYFAKLPTGQKGKDEFRAVPHNDTDTKGLWSAAAEFSALFGSETVVTKETLVGAGLRLEKVSQGRPKVAAEATEAWGWRGIVSLDDDAPVVSEVRIAALFPELESTLNWAIETSLQSVGDQQRMVSTERANHLRRMVRDAFEEAPEATLSDFYRRLLPNIYNFCAGDEVDIEATCTTELLKFNRNTCGKPRFDLANLFVSPESAAAAHEAYNEAIGGSEIYGLERFGTGAIPFDLVIPGRGRGTIRIAPRAVVVMTREPIFISLKHPIRHVQDLAEAICGKLGDDCVLIGKAVSLIGMLAREFVFVFHEGASGYVKYSRKLHHGLTERGIGLKMNPILRVGLKVWDALEECNSWIRLPEPLRVPFGTEELTAPSFAARWKDVVSEQESLLKTLGDLRRPLDLIRFLEQRTGGSWHCLANEYGRMHSDLELLETKVNALKQQRISCYGELRELKRSRVEAEVAMGAHFREKIYEREPAESDISRRKELHERVEELIHEIVAKRKQIKELLHQQGELVGAPEIRAIHDRRRTIELEAELKRLRLIRQAVITSKGLVKANHRPGAWWFPLLCPDGGWFKAAVRTSECYLEIISP